MSQVWRTVDRRVASLLVYPETRAALASAVRRGRLRPAALAAARPVLERLWEEVERVTVTDRLAHRAGDLAEAFGLRGYDAVHLASFEAVSDGGALLVTFDDDLRRTARESGFMLAPRLS